ncbi:MAG: hypothetical protein NVS3B10_00510 [Polyangiales bacterium]
MNSEIESWSHGDPAPLSAEKVADTLVAFLRTCPTDGPIDECHMLAWHGLDGRLREMSYRPCRGVLRCRCGMPLADGRWIRDGAVHEDAVHKVIVDHISACTWEAPSNADLGSAS